ncbi:hypothetical protein [Haloprofundus salilacus]|uniref:hypothetical protein n=1 Tax=Haloprofundus salilacus TaxID=2876190 RepID=UPI001CCA69FC|nr:hypothetical protein [Haloprofundus salilacus]
MMWQDLIFLAGSVFSLVVLVPTLRDSMANVPLGTTLPSATIGVVYGTTFFTLGMTLSAVGSLLTGVMWSLIALLRSPHRFSGRFDAGSESPSPRSAPQNAD